MASTRAEFGLRMSREWRKSLLPSGERARSTARTPTPKPPAAPPLAPNPPEELEEPAEKGAPGAAGRGAAPEPLLGRSRASVSAQTSCATAAMRAPSPAAMEGGPRMPKAFIKASLGATAKAPGRSHVEVGAFAAAVCCTEGSELVGVTRPPSATGAGDNDEPAAGIAAVSGGAEDIGSGATGAPPPGSSAGEEEVN